MSVGFAQIAEFAKSQSVGTFLAVLGPKQPFIDPSAVSDYAGQRSGQIGLNRHWRLTGDLTATGVK